MQLFHSSNIEGNTIILDAEESRHAIQVLRKQAGDELQVMDGKGNLFSTRISEANRKSTRLELIGSTVFEKRKAYLHIAIAPTKNIDRIEWLLEKAVEMGVEEVSFLECFHSERRVLKMERLEKIVVSACKQSKTWHFPRLNSMTKFHDFIAQAADLTRYIATCDGQETQWSIQNPAPEKCIVLIGPEGDFSTEEIELAKSKGYTSLALGEKRLRTETAGIQACSWFNLFYS